MVGDPAIGAWVDGLPAESASFDWDTGNRTKNRKHSVEADDVEATLEHPALFEGRIVEPVHEEPRWLLLGQDNSGRRLALIFTRRGDRLRPVSCRSMRSGERKRYEEALKKG